MKKEEEKFSLGRIEPRPLVAEMQESYLDYAMSVIVSRALPDVRDGLKPVHRRVLYAMWHMGLKPSQKHRKSATVVGEVLGKYHPHGDVAVYDSLVRLAQDFNMRYPLIDGQGNFGSVDGDSAAAMRYTECRLEKISEELLTDIEKETIPFAPNYDGTQKEPLVLPSKIPHLLLNGTMGIAVGMATSIPPHNLLELCDALIHLADHPSVDVEALMQFVKGPDFPTGGQIFNVEDIKHAYATGKGSFVVRGKAEILEEKGQTKIIITELPYNVNKAHLIEHIALLVKDKKLDGIKDLRDESDRDGMRISVDLKKDAYPKKILNRLYTLTDLQTTYHMNMLALIGGLQPRVLTLKMVLEEYLNHRKEVITLRTKFDLNKAEERAHILKGLVMAIEKIDDIIRTIKKSKDKDDAKINIIKKFSFTDRQAVAILEMKLQQLANLERVRVEEELEEKKKLIKHLKEILGSEKKIIAIIVKELGEMKAKYPDPRRTQVVPHAANKFSQEDLIPKEPAIVILTRDGYIKRQSPDTFQRQHRGGKGVIGLTTKEEDMVDQLFTTNTHADLLFFTSRGRVFQMKVYDIPLSSRVAKGQALVNFLQLAPQEKVSSILSIDDLKSFRFLVMVTSGGVMKKTDIAGFLKIRASGLIAIKLKPGDGLEWVKPSTGDDEIVLTTSGGQAIRFKEKDVRSMGRTASGVRAIRLKSKQRVCGMDIIRTKEKDSTHELLVVMENGFGKRTGLKSYKIQHRGGSGIKTAKVTPKTGEIVQSFLVASKAERDIIAISVQGQMIRMPVQSVSLVGRATQGVRLMRFKEAGDKVASVTLI